MSEQATLQHGIRVGHEMLAFVRHDETIRPILDRIVLEPLPVDHGTILEYAYCGRPVRGRVLAVGPGRHPIKYDGPKGKRTKSWNSKVYRPCDVRVGDTVDIGGLDIGGYLFPLIRWGDKDVVICREEDVTLVVEP